MIPKQDPNYILGRYMPRQSRSRVCAFSQSVLKACPLCGAVSPLLPVFTWQTDITYRSSCTEGCSRLTYHFGSRVVCSLIASRPQPKLYQRPSKSAPSSVSPSPSNFSGNYTIPPTYASYFFPRGCLTRTLHLLAGRPRHDPSVFTLTAR